MLESPRDMGLCDQQFSLSAVRQFSRSAVHQFSRSAVRQFSRSAVPVYRLHIITSTFNNSAATFSLTN